jgi:hypothetical protein
VLSVTDGTAASTPGALHRKTQRINWSASGLTTGSSPPRSGRTAKMNRVASVPLLPAKNGISRTVRLILHLHSLKPRRVYFPAGTSRRAQ